MVRRHLSQRPKLTRSKTPSNRQGDRACSPASSSTARSSRRCSRSSSCSPASRRCGAADRAVPGDRAAGRHRARPSTPARRPRCSSRRSPRRSRTPSTASRTCSTWPRTSTGRRRGADPGHVRYRRRRRQGGAQRQQPRQAGRAAAAARGAPPGRDGREGLASFLQVLAFYSPDEALRRLLHVELRDAERAGQRSSASRARPTSRSSAPRTTRCASGCKPDRLAQLHLTPGDIVAAVNEQNAQFAAGKIGQPPTGGGQELVYTITTQGPPRRPEGVRGDHHALQPRRLAACAWRTSRASSSARRTTTSWAASTASPRR